jgi:hypothetical protein
MFELCKTWALPNGKAAKPGVSDIQPYDWPGIVILAVV